jgi:hypothetical protein
MRRVYLMKAVADIRLFTVNGAFSKQKKAGGINPPAVLSVAITEQCKRVPDRVMHPLQEA